MCVSVSVFMFWLVDVSVQPFLASSRHCVAAYQMTVIFLLSDDCASEG